MVRLALVIFACRAFVPVGFMPAFGAGGPITVCHGGVAGAFFQTLAEQRAATQDANHDADHVPGHEHDSHQQDPVDDHSTGHDAWEHCPIGATFTGATLTGESNLVLLALDHAID